MQRITKSDLQALVNRLNRETGNPDEPYTRTPATADNPHGTLVANIGNYHISQAYGGYALHQMATDGGGVREPLYTGHVPARELYGKIHAFLMGYALAQSERPEFATD